MSTSQLTGALESAAQNLAVRAHLGAAELAEALGTRLQTARTRATDMRYFGWILIVGIVIVAAAVAWAWCQYRGYRGFRGGIRVARGPFGIVIGTYLECY